MPKLKFKKKENKTKKIVRITNDNIDKQREEVIAQGKKFKYPFQYSKHRLVINTILISVAAVLLLVLGVVTSPLAALGFIPVWVIAAIAYYQYEQEEKRKENEND